MSILFDRTRPVKGPADFGRGVFARRAGHTASDEAWLVADNARREADARALDRLVDELAGEADAVRRLETGLCL
jgi:hypothetical protein